MKKTIKYMCFVALFVVFCFVTSPANAQTTTKHVDAQDITNATFNVKLANDFADISLFSQTDETQAQRYGRTVLAKLENAEVLLHAYDCFVYGIANAQPSISVDCDAGILSETELEIVLNIYLSDYPETFWLDRKYSYSVSSDGAVKEFFPKYTISEQSVDATTIMTEKEKFESVVESIIQEMYQNVPEGESAYETQYGYALWLHDKVADIVEYEVGPNNQTAYGVLIDRKAVCAGYSRAYQCLLNKIGIKAWSVKGQSVDPVTGGSVNHEWNLLWLDGNCVYVDVTWDDQQQDIYHLYFARSLQDFNLDHVPFSGIYSIALPEGNDDKCQHSGYFEHTHQDNIITGEITQDKIKSLFTQLGISGIWDAVVYDPTGKDFDAWLSAQEDLNCIVPDGFDGNRRGFIINNMGNTTQGVEYHISIVNADTSRLYMEQSSDKTECNFRMVSVNDNPEKPRNLCLAFYDQSGALMSLSIQQPQTYYQHIHINVPEGCYSYKVMLVENGSIKPLCKSISKE